jgi:uncharacterized protein YfiM (DUF2279 family)
MIARIRKFFADRRAEKALRMRRRLKYEILMEDMRNFFDGKKTAEESLKWRDFAYAEVDRMTDDEILES